MFNLVSSVVVQPVALRSLGAKQALPCRASRPREAARQPHPQRLHFRTAAAQQEAISGSDLTETGKLISKVEIPAFIPRSDLGEQLMRWAFSIGHEEGLANFGLPMRVNAHTREDGSPNGFIVEIIRDGVTVTTMAVIFDNEICEKHEWVGRGADGFPTLEGKVNQILGKNLMIRKIDDNSVDEPLRAAIRGFCEALVSALNKYYAFGSCFTDDTT